MITRRPIIGGNWKMNTHRQGAKALASAVRDACGDVADAIEIVLFPPFPYLIEVGEILAGSAIRAGAQDVFDQPEGAFTGEISTDMVRDCGGSAVLVGHSERRHVIGETDHLINNKLHATLAASLDAVLCVGETIEERLAGDTENIVLSQLEGGLEGVTEGHLSQLVIAYEPVWAIGTGHTAQPSDAQNVHAVIRQWLARRYDERFAAELRIQYGGSVKPDNAEALIAQPDVDGFLVGGASLKAADFSRIVRAARVTA